ncbi:MAG: class I SAM-dependent RNA methyltransferase [Clostridia bacterium]|nr:class I SAM-dependent RNA methyltransferase [Clostridia bacterium]
MSSYEYLAPTIFGVEGIAAGELKRMGADNVRAENGKVLFSGDLNILARANINSRFTERILINLKTFRAISFTELFDNVTEIPFENFIARDDAFPVVGSSLKSKLQSVPDCQSIIKKAIVNRLSKKYNIPWFSETGSTVKIRFSILNDTVTIGIDTSGEGLHKRGYRRNSNEAPLKETLAAAMCDTARIFPDTTLYDPFCGSGTILIEAALMATKRAPGLSRSFTAEKFGFIPPKVWQEERARARDNIIQNVDFMGFGFDLDKSAVELTLHNAKKAGVEKYVKAAVSDIRDFKLPEERMVLITNPPYGERLLDVKQAEELYKVMGEKFIRQNGKKYFIISPDDDFEKCFGREADKRRKLYNGMIKCQLYMYFKNTGDKAE